MDREHVKGAADKAKGAIKEGAGKLTGDKDLETEGKIDKAKGSASENLGPGPSPGRVPPALEQKPCRAPASPPGG